MDEATLGQRIGPAIVLMGSALKDLAHILAARMGREAACNPNRCDH
jgi:hypothetical protein